MKVPLLRSKSLKFEQQYFFNYLTHMLKGHTHTQIHRHTHRPECLPVDFNKTSSQENTTYFRGKQEIRLYKSGAESANCGYYLFLENFTLLANIIHLLNASLHFNFGCEVCMSGVQPPAHLSSIYRFI